MGVETHGSWKKKQEISIKYCLSGVICPSAHFIGMLSKSCVFVRHQYLNVEKTTSLNNGMSEEKFTKRYTLSC